MDLLRHALGQPAERGVTVDLVVVPGTTAAAASAARALLRLRLPQRKSSVITRSWTPPSVRSSVPAARAASPEVTSTRATRERGAVPVDVGEDDAEPGYEPRRIGAGHLSVVGGTTVAAFVVTTVLFDPEQRFMARKRT